MLGKLSRWLRILGYDSDYKQNEEDSTLINLANEKDRILLTKDVELYRKTVKAGVEAFLLESENETENLAKIARHYKLELEFKPDISRCPKCNAKLKSAPIEEAKSQVPPTILKSQYEFWQCANSECQNIYWKGSHWRKIKKGIEEAKRRAAS